jgi:hypothetical protein
MGMFDYFRSSYDLGEQFTNVVCQTKDIEDGIGGTMTNYWLDPAGQLWTPDYRGTSTYEVIQKDDPRYNPKSLFLNFEWIPTGQHGKFSPLYITKYIEVYPESWKGEWETWPRLKLHFRYGKLQDFQDVTHEREGQYSWRVTPQTGTTPEQ